jgi:hypothetical protein
LGGSNWLLDDEDVTEGFQIGKVGSHVCLCAFHHYVCNKGGSVRENNKELMAVSLRLAALKLSQ